MTIPILFTKPFGSLDRHDISTLLGWPESGQVEFKKDIHEQNGRRDPWHEGKRFADFGRDKLFKEIVAFANTLGGGTSSWASKRQKPNRLQQKKFTQSRDVMI